jgi:hypothetical protein
VRRCLDGAGDATRALAKERYRNGHGCAPCGP